MDFFAQQDKARKNTKWLILYFSIAVMLIVAAIYFVVLFAFSATSHRHHLYTEQSATFSWWDANVFLYATIGTLAVIFGGCAYKMQELAGGGSILAESLGGRLVATNTKDPDERKLLNVVEEMSIASGVPVPQVYVLDDEMGINAFAAGHTTSDAVVAVTRGCMRLLSRDELQGVIGHEFSHILNGDMKLNIRLIGILFGILCIATLGRGLMRARGRNAGGAVMMGVLVLIIGSIGVFFGRLIQAAVSRQREFLADASSVQFTRNPLGLSGALQKIGGYGEGSWINAENAPDAGHLFFGNGNRWLSFSLMATHPPLDNRIRAIDTTWDGKFKQVDAQAIGAVQTPEVAAHPVKPRPFVFDGKTLIFGTVMAQETMQAQAQPSAKKYAFPTVGNPTPLHLEYAEKFRNALPEEIRAAAREPLDATALIYAMLLSCDEPTRVQQLSEIAKRVSAPVSEKAASLFLDVSQIATHAHLPIINLALGALNQMNCDQFEQFSATLDWLVNSDGKVELFEFVLQKVVQHHLAPNFTKSKPPVVQYYSVKPLVADCAVLLSAIAYGDTKSPQAAFDAGAPYLRSPDDSGLQLQQLDNCGIDALDKALNRLALAAPQIKKNLIEACVHVAGADGSVAEMEAELLRAFGDTLGCPIPPVLTEIPAAEELIQPK